MNTLIQSRDLLTPLESKDLSNTGLVLQAPRVYSHFITDQLRDPGASKDISLPQWYHAGPNYLIYAECNEDSISDETTYIDCFPA